MSSSANEINEISHFELRKIIAEQEKKIAALQAENTTLKQNSILLSDTDEEIFSLKEILALMPGNIFWKDKEGRCIGCNNNLAKFFGCDSPSQLIGKRNSDFIPREYAEILDKADQEIMASKQGKYLEEIALDLNNQIAYFFTHKIPLFNPKGEVVGLLGMSLNITEHKKLEEDLKVAKEKAEASNRAKSQFLAVINHELRTPLSSIVGLLEFLKQDDLSLHEEKNIIEAIENCTEHLLNLVNDVLDFSRLETGKYHLKIAAINLNHLIYEVCSMVKTLVENKGLELRIHISSDIPQIILTDPRILRQILINLVSNAVKFTEKGHITIQIRNLKQTSKKVQLEISVIDTGQGIPSDKLDLIFKPFQQLEDAYTRQSSRSGTGLGLTIVKKLAKLIHAKVSVASKPKQGSTFSLIGEFEMGTKRHESQLAVKLPLPEKTLDKNSRKNTSANSPIYPDLIKEKPTVLLVEDDPIIQFVHKKMLLSLGCQVDVVAHGHAALKTLGNHNIMFVDISLPDISGFKVIQTIRKQEKFTQIPIIALTVYTGKEEKMACLEAGANEFMSKPVSQAQLKKILLKYLR